MVPALVLLDEDGVCHLPSPVRWLQTIMTLCEDTAMPDCVFKINDRVEGVPTCLWCMAGRRR